MPKLKLSAVMQIVASLILVLFISSCDVLNRVPQPRDPGSTLNPGLYSCSATNKELELAEASVIELQLACLIIDSAKQQRSEMHYHPTLGEIARARAEDMALNGYYGKGRKYPPHVDNEGYGPNHYLCLAEYRGDSFCSDDPFANSVESIAGGYQTPGLVFQGWYRSDAHRRHILGEIPYFARSNHYGVGHAVGYPQGNDDLVNMWVFIAAPPPDIVED